MKIEVQLCYVVGFFMKRSNYVINLKKMFLFSKMHKLRYYVMI